MDGTSRIHPFYNQGFSLQLMYPTEVIPFADQEAALRIPVHAARRAQQLMRAKSDNESADIARQELRKSAVYQLIVAEIMG